MIKLNEDIVYENDEAECYYYDRVSNNQFERGAVGKISYRYVLMNIPLNEVILPLKAEPVKVSIYNVRKPEEKSKQMRMMTNLHPSK